MSKLAADQGAINLSQGYPDFDCDPALLDAVARHMREGRNQDAPMEGVPALRQAISAKLESLYGATYDADTEITVTSGGTEAIFDAVAAVVHPGDEVIVFEPVYDSYVPAIEVNGGTAVVVSLRYPDYAVPWDEVRATITPRTRMIMLNSPHNPTATILSASDIAELTRIVDGTDITILSDEVYEHIIFDGTRRGYPELSAFYQRKRDLFLSLIEGSRWKPLPSRGTYFQLLDYSAITDETDMDFALRLTKEHGVASIPTSAFLYKQKAPPVLRFCFAKRDETLRAAAERLLGL